MVSGGYTLTTSNLKIGIVGAGIMGRMLAWQLMNKGHDITLFDKDPIDFGDAAAYTAAGMLTPYSEIESAELMIFHLGMQSLKLWPEMIKQLGGDLGYYQSGSLIVSHAADKPDLDRFNQQLNFKLEQLALPDDESTPAMIEQSKLAELEPELSDRFSQATYLPNEAWLCTRCVMRSLADHLLAIRVSWHAHTEIITLGNHFVEVKNRRHEFDWVVDCRGLGGKPEMPELRGVRGELILLQAPDVRINRLVRLMHPRYRLYIVPRKKDDLYVIGATQIESADSGPITVRSTLELLSAAYSMHPGFSEARVIETKANCRPALANNLPRVETQPGLIRVNGLYRHGFLLAPTLAQEVVQFIAGAEESNYQNLFRRVS